MCVCGCVCVWGGGGGGGCGWVCGWGGGACVCVKSEVRSSKTLIYMQRPGLNFGLPIYSLNYLTKKIDGKKDVKIK